MGKLAYNSEVLFSEGGVVDDSGRRRFIGTVAVSSREKDKSRRKGRFDVGCMRSVNGIATLNFLDIITFENIVKLLFNTMFAKIENISA